VRRAASHDEGSGKLSKNHLWNTGGNLINDLERALCQKQSLHRKNLLLEQYGSIMGLLLDLFENLIHSLALLLIKLSTDLMEI
jgi:hypothetical protein